MIVNDNADLVKIFKDALVQQGIETYTLGSNFSTKIKAGPNQFFLVIINYASQLKRPMEFAKEVKATNGKIKVGLSSGYNFSGVDLSKEEYGMFLQLRLTSPLTHVIMVLARHIEFY